MAGDRALSVEPLFAPLVDAGFACLSISYRLAREITSIGAAVEDVDTAVRYVGAHATEFRIDKDNLALLGESAGGQLAAMAMLGQSAEAVRAAILLYAPMDLERIIRGSSLLPESARNAALGPLAGFVSGHLRELSPIHRVRAGMAPLLLIHGTADPLVPFEQSRDMCKAVRRVGSRCELIAVNGGVHGLRRWEAAGLTSYKRLMTTWLRQQMA